MSNYYNYANIDDTNINDTNTNTNPNPNNTTTTNNANTNNANTNNANTNNATTESNQKKKPKIYEDFLFFGNFFGLVSEPYVKYFNLFALQITCTLVFTVIYYLLLRDFDNNFFIQQGFPKKQFLDYKWGIALIMSINFQTTTAYVDLKCKNFLSRSVITLQIVFAFAITFLFFL
jgi:hypothetical protein